MNDRGKTYEGTAPIPAAFPSAIGGRRVALVIGNSSYRSGSPLLNPQRDAVAIAEAFRSIGFETVHQHLDLDLRTLGRALTDFRLEVSNADTAVVYFAGHGIEIDGVNRLIPVDADLDHVIRVPDETIPLDRVQSAVRGAKKLRVVILDACRDNPFVERMRGLERGRNIIGDHGRFPIEEEPARSIGAGLAAPTDISNMLVAYAADAGKKAKDGPAQGNSPFASALIDALQSDPGLDVRILFGQVHDEVIRRTNGSQQPATYTQLGGGLYSFAPASVKAAEAPVIPAAPSAAGAPVDDRTFEHTRWTFLQSQGSLLGIAQFLHPNRPTYFASDAERLMENRIRACDDLVELENLAKQFADAQFAGFIDKQARQLIEKIGDNKKLRALISTFADSPRLVQMRETLASREWAELSKFSPSSAESQIRDYLREFGNLQAAVPAHNALQRLATNAWRKLNKKDEISLLKFSKAYDGTTEAARAEDELARIKEVSTQPARRVAESAVPSAPHHVEKRSLRTRLTQTIATITALAMATGIVAIIALNRPDGSTNSSTNYSAPRVIDGGTTVYRDVQFVTPSANATSNYFSSAPASSTTTTPSPTNDTEQRYKVQSDPHGDVGWTLSPADVRNFKEAEKNFEKGIDAARASGNPPSNSSGVSSKDYSSDILAANEPGIQEATAKAIAAYPRRCGNYPSSPDVIQRADTDSNCQKRKSKKSQFAFFSKGFCFVWWCER